MSYIDGELISSAQAYTTSWVDLGSEVDTHGLQTFALWIANDIDGGSGAGANLRVRLLGKNPYSATLEFYPPIKTVSSSSVAVEDNYIEFTDDADGNFIIAWTLDKVVPKVQIQISAGTAGDAEVDSASYTAC